jgi:hypothetical protein
MCDICDSEEELTLPSIAGLPKLCHKCFNKRNNMLKSKDYETKEFKTKAESEIIDETIDTNLYGLPKVTDFPPMPKVESPKQDDVKQITQGKRIARLEAIVESAFVIRNDNTVKKLRRQILR